MYITTTKINIPTILSNILDDLLKAGIKPILVGGFVRDYFFNTPSKDFDVELYGSNSLENIINIIEKYGNVRYVGKSFGVLTLKTQDYDFDFALPRKEKKIGKNHQDYEIISDGFLSYELAASRRDFTINSIGYDYCSKKFLDPYGGILDIKNRVLRHIDDKKFCEDSLRVYRAIQFTSRFNLTLHENTKELCKYIVKNDECKYLPKERIFEEFKKLFLKSKRPSIGLKLFKELGLFRYFPQLKDDWAYTLKSLDELVNLLEKYKITDEYKKLYLFYSVLCCNLYKATNFSKDGFLEVEKINSFLNKLTNENKFIDNICTLIKNYHSLCFLNLGDFPQEKIKRVSLNVNIEELSILYLANCLSRDISNSDKYYKSITSFLQKAKELGIHNKPLKALIQGRDLINLGITPSKEFKQILDYAFDLQINYNYSREELLQIIKNKLNIK